jgi:hypothetical protein
MIFWPKTKFISLKGLSQEIWSIVWNLSEWLGIPLGKFAPFVFGKMIGSKPVKTEDTSEKP